MKAEAQVTNKQAKAKAKNTHQEESTEPSNPNKKEATSLKKMGCGTCTSERIEENTDFITLVGGGPMHRRDSLYIIDLDIGSVF